MWTVTRQMPWDTGENTVEINPGGIDYCGPDCLSRKYSGEMESYTDPREAAEAAISIGAAWAEDSGKPVVIGFGNDIIPCTENTEAGELRAWAEAAWESVDKCPHCGEALPGSRERWRNEDSEWTGEEFCSQNCAEMAWEAGQVDEDEE